jgi:hypothetical protein
MLELSASQPEDVDLFVKLEDAPLSPVKPAVTKYSEDVLERVISPQNGELKERFMETLQEIRDPKVVKSKSRTREKSVGKALTVEGDQTKQSVGAAVASALRKGGRGRPVLVSLLS